MTTALPIKQALATPENLEMVAQWIDSNPEGNRTGLAKYMCQQLNWRDPRGSLQVATTLKALRDLDQQGHFKLPEPVISGPRGWNARGLGCPVPLAQAVPANVRDIQGLALIEVNDREHLEIWNQLISDEHPLHDARLVGRQLRYLISSEHGWLGAIGFGSAALHMECRDSWIGWECNQRIGHLTGLINMTRLLVRPNVHCAGLSSTVLGLVAQRVSDDFYRRYGQRPWMMESFVDVSLYDGTSYQAANWICVGQTKGRGRNGDHHAAKSIKDVYVYPLIADFRNHIGVQAPRIDPLNLECGLETHGWAEQEFGACPMGDQRLIARLVQIARDQGAHPCGSYAQATGGDRQRVKGYYRFLNTERQIGPDEILFTHRNQSIRRMASQKVALAINDTMELNFSTRLHCEGLGEVGTNQTHAISNGLDLHSTLALNTEGQPLGVLRMDGYAPESQAGKDPTRPIQEKESYRWIESFLDVAQAAELMTDTMVVFIADREADIFELFDCQRRQPTRVELLIRARCDRSLEQTENKLFDQLAQSPLLGKVSIRVPRQRETKGKPSKPGRSPLPARKAIVEVRAQKVTLSPPPRNRDRPPIELYAVYVEEKNPPLGAKPIRWLLLTTIPVSSLRQAMKMVEWYSLRWRIEEWHRVLKSGCKILFHQNHSAQALLRAMAIDAVIAWRVMLLALLGRDMPEMPADLLFDQLECEVLEALTKKKLSLGQAMITIAKLGGYLDRKCDGPPGFGSLLRGFVRFNDMVFITALLRQRSADASASWPPWAESSEPDARSQPRKSR